MDYKVSVDSSGSISPSGETKNKKKTEHSAILCSLARYSFLVCGAVV